MDEYRAHQREYFDFMSTVPLVFVMLLNTATRTNMTRFGQDSMTFALLFALQIIGLVLFSLVVTSQLSKQHWEHSEVLWKRHRAADMKRFIHISFSGMLEDVVGILATFNFGLVLIARVSAGQCPSFDVWASQQCNHVASLRSVPQEQVLILYVVPIVAQIGLRGITFSATLISYALSFSCVAYSIVHVQGWHELWVLIFIIIFVNIAFEFERWMRVSFLRSLEIQREEKIKIEALLAEQTLATELALKQHELNLIGLENDKKLAEAEKSSLRFLMGNVAHDLKGPLHSISGDIEILQDMGRKRLQSRSIVGESDVAESEEQIFESLHSTIRLMLMAINRSQDYMKSSVKISLMPSLSTFSITTVLTQAMKCVRSHSRDRTIILHPLTAHSPEVDVNPFIISDPVWLAENVMCLLSNAAKYSDVGATVDLQVKVISTIELHRWSCASVQPSNLETSSKSEAFDAPEKLFVHVAVTDTGIGLSTEAHSKLFRPFQQAQRLAGGTGLGLYSLSKRVEALGGGYGSHGRLDGKQGSIFWFAFPYRPDSTALVAETLTPVVRSDASTSISKPATQNDPVEPLSILLIDDSASILKVTKRMLCNQGHTVEICENGNQSLERLKVQFHGRRFDVVLTDLQMPIMDGIESTKRFRSWELSQGTDRNSRQLILGMSANGDEESKMESLDAGMDGFVSKPFRYSDFESALRIARPRCCSSASGARTAQEEVGQTSP